ncbi:hypothetical protein F2P45_34685, partial [Massilia sp. CCM 8733]|nr:hypothetical protein [Massilia mucilaginosa]
LVSAENKKTSPLNEAEVLNIRDAAAVIMVSRDRFSAMAQSRGYADIDPQNCWYDWQMLRRHLGRKPDLDAGAKLLFVSKENSDFNASVAAAQEPLGVFRSM